jgi:hypothetical protein
MIEIETNIRGFILKLKKIPDKLTRGAARTITGATNEITRIMSRPGLQIRYPVSWDSIKQKIFVILKLKSENDLPYTRKGEYEGGWKSESIANGEMVSNVGHKAVFMAGTPLAAGFGHGSRVTPSGQSRIHAGRWRLVRPVIESVLRRLPSSLLEAVRVEVNRE